MEDETDIGCQTGDEVAVRMAALDMAIRFGTIKDFTYGEVLECAEAFTGFLTGIPQ